jgi:hypothetical protein
VLFQDIRTQEHILINLKGMTAGEIATALRIVFSTVQTAAKASENPLIALERQKREEKLIGAGKSILSNLRALAGVTFESAMAAWMKKVL